MIIDPQASQAAHPLIAEWVKVLIGAIAGFLSASLLDVIRDRKQRQRAMHDMRVALYNEIGMLYLAISIWFDNKEKTPDDEAAAASVIRQTKISTYQWAKSQPQVFYKLREAHSIENLYNAFTLMDNKYLKDGLDKHTVEVGRRFLGMVELAVTEKSFSLDIRLFQKEVPKHYELIMLNHKQWLRSQKAAKQPK